jgi:hypothetical protein
VVLTHDVAQRDNLRVGRHDGVAAVIEALKGIPLFAHVTLTRSERSPDRCAGHRDARGPAALTDADRRHKEARRPADDCNRAVTLRSVTLSHAHRIWVWPRRSGRVLQVRPRGRPGPVHGARRTALDRPGTCAGAHRRPAHRRPPPRETAQRRFHASACGACVRADRRAGPVPGVPQVIRPPCCHEQDRAGRRESWKATLLEEPDIGPADRRCRCHDGRCHRVGAGLTPWPTRLPHPPRRRSGGAHPARPALRPVRRAGAGAPHAQARPTRTRRRSAAWRSARRRKRSQGAARAAERKAAAKRKAAAEREAQRSAGGSRACGRRARGRGAPRRASARPRGAFEPQQRPYAHLRLRDARAIARSMVAARGWSSDQFGCLDDLWNRESGWRVTADNPSSSAYGIPQALPGSKMASAGSDWRTSAQDPDHLGPRLHLRALRHPVRRARRLARPGLVLATTRWY